MNPTDKAELITAVLAAIEAKDKEKPCKCDWMQKAQAAGIVIAALAAGISGTFGVLNHGKAEAVIANQVAAVAVAEDVQKKIDDSTVKTDKSLAKLEKSADVAEDAQGIVLWRTWKALEEDADYATKNGLTADAKAYGEKAAEAKKKFETYQTRQRTGKK